MDAIVVEFLPGRFLADPSRLLADSASLWQFMGNVKPCRKNLEFNLKSSFFLGRYRLNCCPDVVSFGFAFDVFPGIHCSTLGSSTSGLDLLVCWCTSRWTRKR